MPQVVFEVDCETQLGDRLVVVGNCTQIGAWSPSSSVLELSTRPCAYPRWSGSCFFESGQRLDFKFAVLKGDRVQWEEAIGNRQFRVPNLDARVSARFNVAELLHRLPACPLSEPLVPLEAAARGASGRAPRRRIVEYTWQIDEVRSESWSVPSIDDVDVASVYEDLDDMLDGLMLEDDIEEEVDEAAEAVEGAEKSVHTNESKERCSWGSFSSDFSDETISTSAPSRASTPGSVGSLEAAARCFAISPQECSRSPTLATATGGGAAPSGLPSPAPSPSEDPAAHSSFGKNLFGDDDQELGLCASGSASSSGACTAEAWS